MVRNLGQKLISVCNSIKLYVKELLVGNKTFTISSGTDFHTNWKTFKTNIANELSNLNIKMQTLKTINNITSPTLNNRFIQNIDKITKKIEYQIWGNIKCIMSELATNEMENIIKDLRSGNFFNLSSDTMKIELAEYIKLGKKFTPYCKVNIKHELELFEKEITKIVNQLVWKESQYIKTNNIFVRFRLLQKTRLVKNNPEISLLLTSILKNFKKERILFKMHLRNKNYGNLSTKKEIEELVKPSSDQILVAADKNVSYVCMDKTDLLEQYDKINVKQHFGKAHITEDWYLRNITQYLQQASENIPDELANIIIMHGF